MSDGDASIVPLGGVIEPPVAFGTARAQVDTTEAAARSLGASALAVAGDIVEAGMPEEIVRRTLERFGRVDILVNNAALARSTRLGDLSADEWRAALEVNLTAPFLPGKFGITVNAICPGMIDTELSHEYASTAHLEQLAASFPVPRLGTAREVADLICFVASEAAGYIPGTSLDINGDDLMM